MRFAPPLKQATLIKRYKRFLADIQLESGDTTTIHCPNTGSMKNCIDEGSPCWYSTSDNPKRKYPFTWEIATTPTGYLAGINTSRAKHLVREAIEQGVISELQGYPNIRAEVPYGVEKSRIDFLLSGQPSDKAQDCYVEVKNVTLGMEDGSGLFPDAVSSRGTKHLRELITLARSGTRAVLVFCVQHTGIDTVAPADTIDPVYGRTLREAADNGVEIIAYRADISPAEIALRRAIPITFSDSTD